MEEIWKDINGFEGLYQISNLGRVKSLERYSIQKHLIEEKILNISHSQAGYVDVSLYKDGKRIHKKPHRLVAEAFIPNPNNLPEVDHIDTNKDNNRIDNLRWCTHSENHLNPLTVELKRKINLGKKLKPEVVERMKKKINVIKDGEVIYTFGSYKDLRETSENILGVKLWDIYARKVIQGKLEKYHGYTFKLAG